MSNLLIVDDFAPIRTSLRLYFEARGLGKCFEASNGVEALRLAKHVKPDVVILDYAMPVMDGATAARVFHEKMPELLARHKDPMASVTTVLNRLVEYGEAEAVMASGRRAWRWVADVQTTPLVTNSETQLSSNVA